MVDGCASDLLEFTGIPNHVFQVSGCLPKHPKILTQFYAVPGVQESVEIRTSVLLPQKNKTPRISACSPLFASFCALLCFYDEFFLW